MSISIYINMYTHRYIYQIDNSVWKKTLLTGITSNNHSESAINIIPSPNNKKKGNK